MPAATLEERFMGKVVWNGDEDECWTWEAAHTPNGYGQFQVDRHPVGAHRFSYELFVGPIPEGLHIDHLCRTRNCVNPAHLEAVTPRENLMRGQTPARANAEKTHCPYGHPLDGKYLTGPRTGKRYCRECRRIRERGRVRDRSK